MGTISTIPGRKKLLIPLLLIMACLLVGMYTAPSGISSPGETMSLGNPTMSLTRQRYDSDTAMLYGSIDKKPTFASTWAWWHESWAPELLYWRPLTMQTLWIESRVFGEDHPVNWLRFSFVLHVATTLLFAWCVFTFFRRWDVAVLSVALYSWPRPGWLPYKYWQTPDVDIIYHWKDQPDLWVNLLIFAAILLALKRKWLGCVACCLLSVCFKESGWLSFPLVATALVFNGNVVARARESKDVAAAVNTQHSTLNTPIADFATLKQVPIWAHLTMGIGIVALVALRWSAGRDVFFGHSAVHNAHPYWRYWNMAMDSEFTKAVWNLGSAIFAIGLAYVALRRPPLVKSVLWIVISFLVAVTVRSIQFVESWDIAVAGTFLFGLDWIAVDFVWIFLAYALFKNKSLWRPAIAFVALACVSALIAMASPYACNPHQLVLTKMFQTPFVAAMFIAGYESVVRAVKQFAETSSNTGSSMA